MFASARPRASSPRRAQVSAQDPGSSRPICSMSRICRASRPMVRSRPRRACARGDAAQEDGGWRAQGECDL